MGDDGKKKKIALLGASILLVAAVVGTVAATLTTRHSSNGSGSQPLTSSVKSIESICQPTDYKDTCVSALSKAAGNTTDPKELINAAFQVTVDHIHQAMNQSAALQALAKDPDTSGALENCKEVLDYAIDDLHNSINKFTSIDLQSINTAVDDLKIWLSAVIAYEETCLDGFDNKTSPGAAAMRTALNATQQLTDNALAIVDATSKVLKQYSVDVPNAPSRRLLSQQVEQNLPRWVSPKGRRLLQMPVDQVVADATVAQDGSGNFRTINEALKTVPKKNVKPFVIRVKAGIYTEKVVVDKHTTNVVMIGDGPTVTKVTGNLNAKDGTKTFGTASFTAMGTGFIAKNMGFENTAGPDKHQAVALLVQSDNSVFYNCQMDGYQDTLYAHSHRQFYRDCTISGTIDFIFGDAASYFQNCLIIVRKPMDNQQNIVTAHGRKSRFEPTAIILHNCTIRADPELEPVKARIGSYLARPWKGFSTTYVMQSDIGDFIHPDGWLPWNGQMYLDTLTYSEFDNRGLGSDMSRRVKWPGIKTTDFNQAQELTMESYMRASTWLPPSGVPFIPGLLPIAQPNRIH